MSETGTGVLLATDLDFRCDRATDRAIALARRFGGEAMAATVVEAAQLRAQQVPMHEQPEWYRAPSPVLRAERRLHREFDDAGAAWRIEVGEGRAGEHLLGVLDRMPPDTVIVTGPVREGVLGPTVLGSTVDRLLRHAGASLLMVRERVHANYRHLLVASDFSAPSRLALQRARELFPQARIDVLHGFAIPRLGLMDRSQDQALATTTARLREEGRAFLRDAGVDGEVELFIEPGDPARLAQQHVDTFAPDLVVTGTHGHGAVYELVIGSVARRIVTTVEADMLVVRH